MLNLKKHLDALFVKAMNACHCEVDTAIIKLSTQEAFGDYQVNGVMAAAKRIKANPRELAQSIVNALDDPEDMIDRMEVAGPGFINIYLSASWLASHLTQASSPPQNDDVVVVDYSSPNLAKEMHVGHLRSTIIGDVLVRVLEHCGYSVIRQNHVGDWGTQFGMLLAYMQRLDGDMDDLSLKLSDLESFYRAAKQCFDTDEAFAKQARQNVVNLQSGDQATLALWSHFVAVSLSHCQAIYERLSVTLEPKDVMPESAYNSQFPDIIKALSEQQLLTESQGALCVFLNEFADRTGKVLPIIVQKRDGGYLYATSDLAALRYRSSQLEANRIIYCTDARQSLHFQLVFSLARKAHFVPENIRLDHFAFGAMLGKDGKPFKTRAGDTVKLTDLLDEATDRAEKLLQMKNPDVPESEWPHMARIIGNAAVKYADLSKNRHSDYVFDWDKMLNFEGNTSPYLQYAYARIQSLLQKAQAVPVEYAQVDLIFNEPLERLLAVKLVQFDEVINAVAQEGQPHVLCNYLYDLATLFMRFYEQCPILKAGVAVDIQGSRLRLSALTAQCLQKGLDLLGIETLERM